MGAPFSPIRPLDADEMRAGMAALLAEGEAKAAERVDLDAARSRHARRALEAAADHGAALLAALGLPRLVDDGFVPLDPVAAGDALEAAIAALDAVDAPGEDLEPWLAGSYDPHIAPADAEWVDEDEDDDPGEAEPDDEASIAWPEDVRALMDPDAVYLDADAEHDDADLEDGDSDEDHREPWPGELPPAGRRDVLNRVDGSAL